MQLQVGVSRAFNGHGCMRRLAPMWDPCTHPQAVPQGGPQVLRSGPGPVAALGISLLGLLVALC